MPASVRCCTAASWCLPLAAQREDHRPGGPDRWRDHRARRARRDRRAAGLGTPLVIVAATVGAALLALALAPRVRVGGRVGAPRRRCWRRPRPGPPRRWPTRPAAPSRPADRRAPRSAAPGGGPGGAGRGFGGAPAAPAAGPAAFSGPGGRRPARWPWRIIASGRRPGRLGVPVGAPGGFAPGRRRSWAAERRRVRGRCRRWRWRRRWWWRRRGFGGNSATLDAAIAYARSHGGGHDWRREPEHGGRGDPLLGLPTSQVSVASPAARALSASPGSRWRCETDVLRWLLDEGSQSRRLPVATRGPGSAAAISAAESVAAQVTFSSDGTRVTLYDLQGRAAAILAAASK